MAFSFCAIFKYTVPISFMLNFGFMKYCILIIFLINSFLSKAQINFEKIIYDNQTIGIDVMVLPDSSVLALTASNVLIKTDSLGNFLWSRKITGNNSNDLGPVKFLKTYDDQIILLNLYYISWSVYGSNILKIDTAGTILWSKTFFKIYPQDIVLTEDSGFILSGNSPDSLVGTVHYNRQLIKLDSAGGVSWTRLYGRDSLALGGVDSRIIQMNAERLMIVYSDFPYMKLLITDSIGNPIYANAVSSGYWSLRDLTRIHANAFLILTDNRMSCVDSTGTLIWTRNIPGNFSEYHDADRINDSLVVIAGRDYSIDIMAGLFWMDASGLILRNEFYHNRSGEIARALSVSPFPGGGHVLTGETMITFGQIPSMFIIRTDTNDFLDCGHASIGVVTSPSADSSATEVINSITTISNLMNDTITSIAYNVGFYNECFSLEAKQPDIDDSGLLTLYPNPISTNLKLYFHPQIRMAYVEIFNHQGERIMDFKCNSSLIIDCHSLTQGIYFLKAETEKGSAVQKFIKQ